MKCNNGKGRILAIALMLAGTAVPQLAHAGDEDKARAAVAAAKGRIDAAVQAGATDTESAGIVEQARTAANEAERLIKKKDNEDASWHKAMQATALANLAIATSELQKLQQQRDQLRAGQ